jgi:hypothetical protein
MGLNYNSRSAKTARAFTLIMELLVKTILLNISSILVTTLIFTISSRMRGSSFAINTLAVT